jgi:tetratricopeptide (TPR) repeat protein
LGKKQKALGSLNEALALQRAIENSAAEAVTLNNIGRIHLSMGEPQQALDSYKQALDIQKRLKLPPLEAETLKNQALVYSSLGDYQLSLNKSEEALKIFEQVGDRTPFHHQPRSPMALTNLTFAAKNQRNTWYSVKLILG